MLRTLDVELLDDEVRTIREALEAVARELDRQRSRRSERAAPVFA